MFIGYRRFLQWKGDPYWFELYKIYNTIAYHSNNLRYSNFIYFKWAYKLPNSIIVLFDLFKIEAESILIIKFPRNIGVLKLKKLDVKNLTAFIKVDSYFG